MRQVPPKELKEIEDLTMDSLPLSSWAREATVTSISKLDGKDLRLCWMACSQVLTWGQPLQLFWWTCTPELVIALRQ